MKRMLNQEQNFRLHGELGLLSEHSGFEVCYVAPSISNFLSPPPLLERQYIYLACPA